MIQRQTKQKEIVIQELNFLAGQHPSADAVYNSVHIKYPKISKATVFRILKDEAEKGKILSIDVPRDVNRYDHRIAPHWHIKCRVCGKVDDVEIVKDFNYQDYAIIKNGFDIEYASLVFSGLCVDCKNKGERK